MDPPAHLPFLLSSGPIASLVKSVRLEQAREYREQLRIMGGKGKM